MLAAIAGLPEGAEQARKIAAAIRYTFEKNKISGRLPPSPERNKGYWCYEWAYAFAAAATHVLNKEKQPLFVIQVESASTQDGRVHYWVRIKSVETGQVIYVDDGFGNGNYVNYSRPQPPGYDSVLPEPIKPVRSRFVQKRFFITVDRFTMPAIYDDEGRLVRPAEEPIIAIRGPNLPRGVDLPRGLIPVKCFPAGTPVITPEGPIPIERLAPGDAVLAYDPASGCVLVSRIERVQRYRGRYRMVQFSTAGAATETLHVTAEHAFLTASGWVSSGALRCGIQLRSARFSLVSVAEIKDMGERECVVYNLRTKAGNYLVGKGALVVADRPVWPGSNCVCCGGTRSGAIDQLRAAHLA